MAPKETMSHACEGIQSERAPELAPHARFSFSASTSSIRAQSLLALLLSLIVPYSNCIHDSRLASCERFHSHWSLDASRLSKLGLLNPTVRENRTQLADCHVYLTQTPIQDC